MLLVFPQDIKLHIPLFFKNAVAILLKQWSLHPEFVIVQIFRDFGFVGVLDIHIHNLFDCE